MELFLELTWAAIVVLLSVRVWRRRPARHSNSGWSVAVIVIGIAVLIFPYISISDDLCDGLVMVEVSGKRIDTTVPAMTPQLSLFRLEAKISCVIHRIDFREVFKLVPLDGVLITAPDRAPPSLSI